MVDHSKKSSVLATLQTHNSAIALPELLTMLPAGYAERSVRRWLAELVQEGVVQRSGQKRGTRYQAEPAITHDTADLPHTLSLPLAGKIAAGQPIEAIESPAALDLATILLGEHRFALQVQGDSMVDEGILDGDWVIIQQQSYANNGDIVVALIDNEEATLKRFQHRASYIQLIPANVNMTTMTYPADRVKIQGVLVAQLREYR